MAKVRRGQQRALDRSSLGVDRLFPDAVALTALVIFAAIYTSKVVVPVDAFIRGDWPTFFFPTYAELGSRLRDFDIPGWNPHQFAGVPFAADPESGWGYMPAMLLYAIFSPETATILFIGTHIALAGFAAYGLGRVLGLSVAGSFVAGSTFAFAWVATASSFMVIWFQVSIWLLVALAGAELAARAGTWPRRLLAWLLGGIAISQILAAWLGQGAYYALLVLGGWIAFRTLAMPASRDSARARISNALVSGVGLFGTGFALSAGWLLPRLDVLARSNRAAGAEVGSSAWADSQVGFSPEDLLREVLGGYTGSQWWYAGATATALALMAPVVARHWRPIWFFVLLALGSLTLALTPTTPLHVLLNRTLPFFEQLHDHSRERILIVYPAAVAMLAGAFVTFLPKPKFSPVLLLAGAIPPIVLAVGVKLAPVAAWMFSDGTIVLLLAASILTVLYVLLPMSLPRAAILAALVALIVWDPGGRVLLRGFLDETRLSTSLRNSLARDTNQFLHRNGAAQFIADATSGLPSRFAGYDPALLPDPETIEVIPPEIGYRNALAEQRVNELLVFNWATWFGLDDIQGYNPVQVERYVEYIDAINGHRQEYHERDIFPAGLASPLLDLLNTRFVIVPSDAPQREEFDSQLAMLPTVYTDTQVRILENPDAFPRAWLLHEARQVAPGEALPLLANGAVDPRQVALLETVPPPLARPPVAGGETVDFRVIEPDRLALSVEAASASLLVLSEAWDPGWSATVDGVPAAVLQTNHVFRGVPVLAGSHIVELRYDPPLLRLGLTIALATTILLIIAITRFTYHERRATSALSQAAESDPDRAQ